MSSDLRERRRQQQPPVPAIHASGNGTTNGSGSGNGTTNGSGSAPSAYSGYYGTTAATSPHNSASSGMNHHSSPQNSASNIGYQHNAASAGSNGSNGSNANGSAAAATGSSSRQYMYQAKKAGGYDGYPQSSAATNLLSVGVGHGDMSGDETKNRRRRFSFGGKKTTFSSLQLITCVLSITTLIFFSSTLHYRSKYSTSARHVDHHITSQTDLEAKLRGREKHVKFLEERMVEVENDKKKLKEETAEAKREKVVMERRMQDALRKAGQAANQGKMGEEKGKPEAATDAGLEADAVGRKTQEEEQHIERHAPEIEADEKHHPHWDGLSAYSKMAAAVLGYDQHSWDDGAYVHPIFERTLEELTDEERSASSLLWLDEYFRPQDEERRRLGLPSEVADEIEKDPFHHPYWDELSEYSRAAATVVGYDQHSWDSEDVVHLPIFERTLDELGDEEREASKFLWLDEFFQPKEGTAKESSSSNEEDEPKAAPEIGLNAAIRAAKKAAEEEKHPTEHAPEIEADEKHHPYWDGLSAHSRMAAAVLGYDKDSWDNNVPLPIFDHTLDELSDEERSAATLLWLDDYFLPQEEEDKV